MSKKIKNILFITTILFLGILCFNTKESYANECTVDGITYNYDLVEDNAENVTIKLNQDESLAEKDVTIPETLDSHKVVSIGDGKKNILGHGIIEVGTFTTGGQVNDSINRMKSLKLPNGLTQINDYALCNVGVESTEQIAIPNTVTKIGNWSFANVKYNLWSAPEIKIPDGVQTIGDYAFANVFSAFEYNLGDLQTQDYKNSGHMNSLYWVSFPRSMTKLTLGTGLETIGKYAFLNQCYLKEITIPTNIKTIDEGAFVGCSINNITITDREEEINIGQYAFAKNPVTKIDVKKEWKLGFGVFADCRQLKEVNFEDGITEIPEGMCAGCTAITTEEYTEMTQGKTKIGTAAFKNCTGLTGEVTIPSSATTLGTEIFNNCSNIEKAKIESNVTEIPDSTFENCVKLTDVQKQDSVTKIGQRAFYNCEKIDTNEYNDIIKNITSIGSYAFSECTGLTGEILVDNIVTTLGKYVFSECSNIETAKIETTNITAIPDGTYKNCTKLANITEPDTITSIGAEAFYHCTELSMEEYNDLSENVTEYKKSAFEGCTGLEGTLTIKRIVKNVYESAFKDCTNINQIEFEDDVKDHYQAFSQYSFYNTAPEQEIYRIHCENSLSIGSRSFTNGREVFIDTEESYTSKAYKWAGDSSVSPIVHYSNCKHYIDITCTLPGVSLVDPNTNEVLTSKEIECETDFKFKLVIDEAYAEKYKDMCIRIISEGKYTDSDLEEETIELTNGQEYTFEKVTRNKQIIVLAKKDGTDLVLRQFISKINEIQPKETRDPDIQYNRSGINTFNYNHTKYPVTVKTGDEITNTIRVYNEGEKAGQVNEIKVRLQAGQIFDKTNQTNQFYKWKVSEDGKTITTDYLEGTEIEKYSGSGRPQYAEIQFVCKVAKIAIQDEYLVTISEISSGNDEDSAEDTCDLIEIENYNKDQSYMSSRDTYTKGEEDDTDYEAVLLKGEPTTGFSLVVNKIDTLNNELLNGAKVQLLDENKKLITEGVTTDGTINFGSILSYGEGTDTYYLNEVETPAGYMRTMDGMIQLQVIKTIDEYGNLELEVVYDTQEIEEKQEYNAEVDENLEFIPITTKDQLLKIGTEETINVSGKDYTFAKKANYKLQNDIDLNNEPIKPIEYMEGIFDGNEHKIINLTIGGSEDPEENAKYKEIGLFRHFKGEIRNLTIENCSIIDEVDDSNEESLYGQPATGALVGYMEAGTITNSKVIGGTVTSVVQNVGGFVGHTKFGETVKFDKCSSELGEISGNYNVGGFVGCSKGTVLIYNCSTSNGPAKGNTNVGGYIGNSNGNVTIENSTNGKVIIPNNSSLNCAGGFIGYASPYNTVVIEDCKNTATIQGDTNIGGIVGYSESIINIVNCTNEGEIPGSVYNAGGIIGKSQPIGSANPNTIVQVSSAGHTINVYIKNKKTEGKYDLNILKVDLAKTTEDKSITGAKFNVYDSEGNLIKEKEEVDENGKLLIGNIPINSLVSDVYYIQEVEAPEGYDILVKELIKVEVTKTWDSVNEKYVINKKAEMVEDTEDVVLAPDNTKTGKTVDGSIYSNVRYKSSKTGILKCTNTALVTANKSNAGGIAGCIVGYSTIEECENMSKTAVSSNEGNAGGIAAELMLVTIKNGKPVEESIVRNCKNSTVVSGGMTAGGILALASTRSQINDCENTGVVQSTYGSSYSSVSGGILGGARGIVSVNYCKNSGSIANSQMSGGIVGNAGAFYYKIIDREGKQTELKDEAEDSIEITNCEVSGIGCTATENQAAGIIGNVYTKDAIIKDCTVNNSNFMGSRSAGGIVGVFQGKDICVENCDVIENTMQAQQSSGVIGSYGLHNWGPSSIEYEETSFTIKDCDVLGSKIGSGEAGTLGSAGILGYIWSDKKVDVDILNCNVGNTENEKTVIYAKNYQSKWGSSGEVAGIFAGNYSGYFNIEIGNCNIEGALIESQNPDLNVAGISGFASQTIDYTTNIHDCKVVDTTISKVQDNGEFDNYQAVGGIFSGLQEGREDKPYQIDITNCDLINTEIHAGDNNVGGMIGTYWHHVDQGDRGDLSLKNCRVLNSKIELNSSVEDGGKTAGGLLGMIYGTTANIENCEVSGLEIINGPQNTGALIGYAYGCQSYSYTPQVRIKNSKLIGYKDESTGEIKENKLVASNFTDNIGGIAGGIYGGLDIDNLEVSDVDIELDNNIVGSYQSAGGLIGSKSEKSASLKDIKVSNIDIDFKAHYLSNNSTSNKSVGGLIGTTNLYSDDYYDISGIQMDNLNIKTDVATVGGLIGSSNISSNISAKDVSITNSSIEASFSPNVAGLIGIQAVSKEAYFEDITLDTIKLSVNNGVWTTMAGGIALTTAEKIEMKNVNANNIDISAKGSSTPIVHTAGLVGASDISNSVIISGCTVNNLNIENDSENGVIGGIMARAGYNKTTDYWGVDTYYNEVAKITDTNVNNFTANGKYAIGGILGCGVATIDKCTVTNPQITGEGSNATAGGAIGIAIERSKLSNIKVTTDETTEKATKEAEDEAEGEATNEPTQYGVFSGYLAGGLVAIDSGSLKDSTVENITVKTSMEQVEQEETSDETSQENNPLIGGMNASTEKCANAIQVESYENYQNCTDTNVQVIIGE